MSRIGKRPVTIPSGVSAEIADGTDIPSRSPGPGPGSRRWRAPGSVGPDGEGTVPAPG